MRTYLYVYVRQSYAIVYTCLPNKKSSRFATTCSIRFKKYSEKSNKRYFDRNIYIVYIYIFICITKRGNIFFYCTISVHCTHTRVIKKFQRETYPRFHRWTKSRANRTCHPIDSRNRLSLNPREIRLYPTNGIIKKKKFFRSPNDPRILD